jgi:predicted glycosyltransferase
MREEWSRDANAEVVARYYDQVWVYGDPSVYDRVAQDSLPGSRKWDVQYTGYLDQCARICSGKNFAAWLRTRLPALDSRRRFALCVVGGGEDGARLAETFARADFQSDSDGVVLAGPFLPAAVHARLRDLARERRELHLLEFTGEPAPLVRNADRVVCMGGYNTLGEVMSYGKHALVVPRVRPRAEQCIRSQRFLELGLVDQLLLPSELSHERLSSWLTAAAPESVDARKRVDLSGLDRIQELTRDLLPSRLEAAGLRA